MFSIKSRSFCSMNYPKNMFHIFSIFVLISFMCGAQGSLQDTTKYENDEKYALISFASQKFLKNPELVKMYSAFYGPLYEQNFFEKNKTSPPFSKKILSLYEVQEFISPRQIVNFQIIIDKTKFQIKTRDGTIYQTSMGEPWFFRPPNSKKKKISHNKAN